MERPLIGRSSPGRSWPRSAEREGVGLHASIEELNLELPIGDPPRLTDQLIDSTEPSNFSWSTADADIAAEKPAAGVYTYEPSLRSSTVPCSGCRSIFAQRPAPESSVRTPEAADTPARRIYFALQTAYIGTDDERERGLEAARVLIAEFQAATTSALASAMLDRALSAAEEDDCYTALKLARRVMRHEEAVLGIAPPPSSRPSPEEINA